MSKDSNVGNLWESTLSSPMPQSSPSSICHSYLQQPITPLAPSTTPPPPSTPTGYISSSVNRWKVIAQETSLSSLSSIGSPTWNYQMSVVGRWTTLNWPFVEDSSIWLNNYWREKYSSLGQKTSFDTMVPATDSSVGILTKVWTRILNKNLDMKNS